MRKCRPFAGGISSWRSEGCGRDGRRVGGVKDMERERERKRERDEGERKRRVGRLRLGEGDGGSFRVLISPR